MARSEVSDEVRGPLTRERALAVAVQIADVEGLAAMTMRHLARELGVEAMSLYHHVANKDDILDGMVEQVFGEMALPAPDAPWKDAMRDRAVSVRSVLLRHPWAVGIMHSRTSPGPATLGHLDAVIATCRRAGFSVAMAAHALSLVDSYVYGFVLQEVNLPAAPSGGIEGVIDNVRAGLAEHFPHLAELTVGHVLQPGYAYGDEFAFGLDVVLDGLAVAASR